MPRNMHKLIGLAAVAAVGLPLTAMAQSLPDRLPSDSPSAVPGDSSMPTPRSDMPSAAERSDMSSERGGMPDLRGALPGASSDQTASTGAGPADTLGAINSDSLIGANVRNRSNEVIGKIDSLLIEDARVVGAVIEVGGFLGIGAHQVAVPMEQLTMIDAGDVSLPAATKDSLKAAPAYEKPAKR